MGIAMIIISMLLIPFVVHERNKLTNVLDMKNEMIKDIDTNTKIESELKVMLIESNKSSDDALVALTTEKGLRMIFIFFFLGCSMVGISIRSRIYLNIIKKLNERGVGD